MTRPVPTCYLRVTDAVLGCRVFPLVVGERVTLGRAPGNRVVLHDERASRFHAEIFSTEAGWVARDLESRNGTLLGGERLTGDRPLATGDVLRIGLAEVHYCDGDPASETTGTIASVAGTGTMPAALEAWHASITHRRTRSRLLDDIGNSVAAAPRVGRAAAALCRLAFALGRATSLPETARLCSPQHLPTRRPHGGLFSCPTASEQIRGTTPPTSCPWRPHPTRGRDPIPAGSWRPC